MLKYGSEGAKQFYEMFVLKPEHAKAHREGDIHIHDMDFLTLTTTCCQIDIEKLFDGGFCTGHGFLREPNSIASYLGPRLHRHPVEPERPARRPVDSQLRFRHGQGGGQELPQELPRHLGKALELLADLPDGLGTAKAIADQVRAEEGLDPILANDKRLSGG